MLSQDVDAEPSPTQAVIKGLQKLGLSQMEISRLTNIPQPRLSRWASGDVAAGADDALRLDALLRKRQGQPAEGGTQ